MLSFKYCRYALFVILIMTLLSCQQKRLYLQVEGLTMGTSYHLSLDWPESERQSIQRQVQIKLDQLEQSMSTYRPDSELSQLNLRTDKQCYPLSQDLYTVLLEAQRIAVLTQGAFDITVAHLVNAWGFGPGGQKNIIPSEALLAELKHSTGFGQLALNETQKCLTKKNPKVHIDLSAIAKGYAVDQISLLLEQQGIENYLVEIGGEIRAKGVNAAGVTWRLGIEAPLIGERKVQRTIALNAAGMATSGDYRNFFAAKGQYFSHTINPPTGKPLQQALASVTVIHPSAMTADALATAMMVMGTEKALALAEQQAIAVLLIERKNSHNIPALVERFSRSFLGYLN